MASVRIEELLSERYLQQRAFVWMSSNSFPFRESFEWPWHLQEFNKRRDFVTPERAVAFNLLSYLKHVSPTCDIRDKLKIMNESDIEQFVSSSQTIQ